MAAVKLVLILLLCTETLQVEGMRINNEEDEPETLDAHIVYDQRQSGKYNIHVVIKDVAIIEMDQNEIADQNYNDDEYYYDEDDLTVKPLIMKPTTTTTNKPLDVTTTTTTKKTTISSTENESIVPVASTTVPTTTIYSKIPTNDENLNMYSLLQHQVVDTKSRSKIEPIYAIEEPTMLQSRHQLDNFNYKMPAQSRDDSKLFKNSKIYKVKVRRSHHITPQAIRCRSFQYRDARGNCRGKRSSSGSILKRLFRMLVTLPFNQQEQQQIDD